MKAKKTTLKVMCYTKGNTCYLFFGGPPNDIKVACVRPGKTYTYNELDVRKALALEQRLIRDGYRSLR